MSSPESSSAVPGGKSVSSSKKLDRTWITTSGSTRQPVQASSTPSNSPGRPVAEYPSGASSKKADASGTEAKTDPAGMAEAMVALTSTPPVPSRLSKPTA